MATRDERAAFDDLLELEEGGGPRFTSGPLDERRPAGGDLPGGPRALTSADAEREEPRLLRERAAPAAEPVRARFARRLAAMLVDLIALGLAEVALVCVSSTAVLAAEGILGHPLADGPDLFVAFVGAGSIALVAGYFIVLHAGPGQTLGKAALGVRVARPDGRPIGIGRSTLRFLGYFVSALPFGIGFLFALASGRRALHDVIGGTAVVRA